MKNVKALMEQRGIGAQELADKIDTTNQQIYRLLNGERRMTLDWLARIAKGLNASVQDIMQGAIISGADAKQTESLVARAGPIIAKLADDMKADRKTENTALGEVFIQYDKARQSGKSLSDSDIERIAVTVFRLSKS